MSMLLNRSTLLPAWLVLFGLIALLASPMTFATGVLLFFAGGRPAGHHLPPVEGTASHGS